MIMLFGLYDCHKSAMDLVVFKAFRNMKIL